MQTIILATISLAVLAVYLLLLKTLKPKQKNKQEGYTLVFTNIPEDIKKRIDKIIEVPAYINTLHYPEEFKQEMKKPFEGALSSLPTKKVSNMKKEIIGKIVEVDYNVVAEFGATQLNLNFSPNGRLQRTMKFKIGDKIKITIEKPN